MTKPITPYQWGLFLGDYQTNRNFGRAAARAGFTAKTAYNKINAAAPTVGTINGAIDVPANDYINRPPTPPNIFNRKEPAMIPRQYNGAHWEQLPTGEYQLKISHWRALVMVRGGWFQWELFRNDNELFGGPNHIDNGMGLTLAKSQFAVETAINTRGL